MNRGTPKSLAEALLFAADDLNKMAESAELRHRLGKVDLIIIESHVRDFLAQKFSTAILCAHGTKLEQPLTDLWDSIL